MMSVYLSVHLNALHFITYSCVQLSFRENTISMNFRFYAPTYLDEIYQAKPLFQLPQWFMLWTLTNKAQVWLLACQVVWGHQVRRAGFHQVLWFLTVTTYRNTLICSSERDLWSFVFLSLWNTSSLNLSTAISLTLTPGRSNTLHWQFGHTNFNVLFVIVFFLIRLSVIKLSCV